MKTGYGYIGLVAGFLALALLSGCAHSSEFEGVPPDDLYELGAQAFDAGDWDRSADAFDRLIFSDPTYPLMMEARMFLARAYYNKGEYITAVSEFTRVLDRNPGHSLAPDASLGVCQSFVAQSPHAQRDQTFTVQAWNACQNTLTDFSGTHAAPIAEALRNRMESKLAEKIFLTGDFYFRRKLYHPGIIYFNDVLAQYPRSEWAAPSLRRLYDSYSSLDWGTEAEEVRDRLLREFPESDAAKALRAKAGEEIGEERGGDLGWVELKGLA